MKTNCRVFAAAAIAACACLVALGDGADEALDLARRTYAYVAKSVPEKTLKPYARELESDAAWLASASKAPAAYRAGIERAIRCLRRRILFLHPDLQFDKLIAVQRGIPYTWDLHMVDQYVGRLSRPGPGLVVLENWKGVPRKKVLLAGKLPEGTVINPDLHWDADRLLFAFCDHTAKPPEGFDPGKHGFHSDVPPNPWIASVDPTHPIFAGKDGKFDKTAEVKLAHRRYFIWECAADGSWVRQLTGAPGDPMETCEGRQTVLIEDIDPCYLPDGGFVFSSTRAQNFGRCHWGRWTPSFLLYRADLSPDGARNIRQLSFGEANEWEPAVLNDGRIAYTRWDYVNRNAVWHQSLWTVRPDGTGVAHLYGNYSERVCVGTEIKPLANSPVCVATASAHHSFTQGSLFLLDPRLGEDGDAPIRRITPECPFPESEGWNLPMTYCNPQPVNDTLFFCARSDEPMSFPKGHPRRHNGSCGASWPTPAAFGIWLVDTLGGRELIYKDPEISTFNPIPVVKRKKPPVIASILPPAAPSNGLCYVENVYESRRDIPKGSVKALRINRLINLPICCRRTTKLGPDLDLYKESLGVVPVEQDGSAAFRIPSGVPIQLQAIDTNGMAILTMRSFIYAQKGEIQGCVGCHENRAQVLPAKPKEGTLARQGPVRDPVPEIDLGYTGPFSFSRSVQPIFDRKCIGCHGLSDKAPFSLVGIGAIANLNARKQIAFAKSYRETHYSKPYDYFAAASPLTKKLKGGHGPALSADEWKRLILWMDFNVPEYALSAGYGWNGPDSREIDPEGEKALRAAIRERLGEAVATQPFDALVNRGDERLSRVLDLVGSDKSPDHARFLALCRKALVPIPYTDKQGTCGRDTACRCRSCWVRCGGYNRPIAAQAACVATAENGITAHRGDSMRLPQNSLRAFSSANRIGADWIETDVHLTKDGQLVISHNATTGEYCSQNKVIKDCTYAELTQLDMAEKFRAQRKLTLEQCPKVTIVRLEEAIDLILSEKKARLSIQPKCDCVDQVMALVRRKGALKWVGFNDGNAKWMSRVKELEPSVPVFWDRYRNMDVDKDIAFAKEHGFETLVLFHQDVTPERVQKLKAAGFKVGAWTVNSPDDMRRFLAMGLDRLYTDDPGTFKKIKANMVASP